MPWIKTFLTLVILLICLALGRAEAAEERPRRIDGAPANAACDVIHAGLTQADFRRVPTPSVDLSAPLDSLIQAPPFLADAPSFGLSTPLGSLVPAPPFLVDTPPVAVAPQGRCPTGGPATTSRRLAWLRRFRF